MITFLRQLVNGDIGLTKPFLIYNVLVGILFNIWASVAIAAGAGYVGLAIAIVWGIWITFIMLSMRNASIIYTGEPIWPRLVKTLIVLSPLLAIATILSLDTVKAM